MAPILCQQESQDPETKNGHQFLLYMVWLMKTEALMDAIRLNPFQSQWFMWCDIGAFRYDKMTYRNWPSPERLELLPKDRVMMSLVRRFSNDINDTGFRDLQLSIRNFHVPETVFSDHLAGGYYAVNTQYGAHRVFYEALWSTYRYLVNQSVLVVKDQTVFNAMFLRNPTLFSLVPSTASSGMDTAYEYILLLFRYLLDWLTGSDHNFWFYVQDWLATPSERRHRTCTLTDLILC